MAKVQDKTRIQVEEFFCNCKDILDSYDIKDVDIKLHVRKGNPGNSRYKGYLGWYHIDLSDVDVFKQKYAEACAIHIKPYCITEDDIKKAKSSDESQFNDEVENDISFVDYDPDSANYHKIIDGEYQIVVVKKTRSGKYGPGWLNDKEGVIKDDWYFPRCFENSKYKDLKLLLKDYFEYILKNE